MSNWILRQKLGTLDMKTETVRGLSNRSTVINFISLVIEASMPHDSIMYILSRTLQSVRDR